MVVVALLVQRERVLEAGAAAALDADAQADDSPSAPWPAMNSCTFCGSDVGELTICLQIVSAIPSVL